MSTTIYIGPRGKPQEEVTLHAGSTYIVVFKLEEQKLPRRMVARFLEMQYDRLLFSLRDVAGTTTINVDQILSCEQAPTGSKIEPPTKYRG